MPEKEDSAAQGGQHVLAGSLLLLVHHQDQICIQEHAPLDLTPPMGVQLQAMPISDPAHFFMGWVAHHGPQASRTYPEACSKGPGQ